MPKWLKVVLFLAVAFWLLRFPPTRYAILWLLPLGSGWDDIVQGVILFLLAWLLLAKGIVKLPDIRNWLKDFFES